MEIRAASEDARLVLEAAAKGDVSYLASAPEQLLRDARCSSGCTALHWAAGSNHLEVITLISSNGVLPVDVPATRKSKGRTPLHYACRNGCLEAAKLLVELGADVDARAKHSVSPFQLAVWQNYLDIAKWLVEEQGVDAAQCNDFDCGAIHWLGICPSNRANAVEESDGRNLLPFAIWLARQPNVDFRKRQRQGHTALHKAAWGGHIALLRHLRDEHGLLDDIQDHAGNFCADLADMANTERHSIAAKFLRQECSGARAESCAILGVPVGASHNEIRRAYLTKARIVHPDRLSNGEALCSTSSEDPQHDFDTLQKAYEHLTLENGVGKQSNPAHCINLMLELHSPQIQVGGCCKSSSATEIDQFDDASLFPARLVAVLLEYGDKGIELCNIKKKWSQVWPDVKFPTIGDGTLDMRGRKKKGALAEYITRNAGDVVKMIEPDHDTGSLVVVPKHCTRGHISEASNKQSSGS